VRRPPHLSRHARAQRGPVRRRPQLGLADSPIDLRRADPRRDQCGRGAPFTLRFLLRLIESCDLLS